MIRQMKRLCLWAFLAGLLLWACPSASAETYYGGSDWQVTFTDKIEENFQNNQITDVLRGLQPKDNAIISIKLLNRNAKTTDWYMLNQVLTSLEDGNDVAKDGAYTYRLTYTGKNGTERVLFDSEKVGGDSTGTGTDGLHGATTALKNYFYLDTLATGESGTVKLEVALDGETQTNDYQNTLADLQIKFATQFTDTTTTTNRQVVKTGDETDLLPLYAAMAASGLVLLALGIYTLKKDKREKGDK